MQKQGQAGLLCERPWMLAWPRSTSVWLVFKLTSAWQAYTFLHIPHPRMCSDVLPRIPRNVCRSSALMIPQSEVFNSRRPTTYHSALEDNERKCHASFRLRQHARLYVSPRNYNINQLCRPDLSQESVQLTSPRHFAKGRRHGKATQAEPVPLLNSEIQAIRKCARVCLLLRIEVSSN